MMSVFRRLAFLVAALCLPCLALAQVADFSCSIVVPASAPANTTVDLDVVCINLGPDDAAITGISNNSGIPPAGPPVVVSGSSPLVVGQSFTQRYPFSTTGTIPGAVFNIGGSIDVNHAGSDPNPSNNQLLSIPSILITGTADLSITKAVLLLNSTAGANVQYTITAGNFAGPGDDAFFSWSDPLPAGTTFVSLSPSAGCTTPAVGANGIVTCSQTVANGSSIPYTLIAKLDPALGAGSTLTNTVTISAPGITDANLLNDSSTATSTVVTSADVAVTKTGPVVVVPGTNVTYTIGVSNAGPSNTTGPTVSDVLPAGTTFFSATNGATYNAGTNTVNFTAGALPVGATTTFDLTLSLSAAFSGTLSNTATVVGAGPDPDPSNNSAIASAPVASANIAVTKSAPVSVTAGGNITYTIGVSNAGPSDAANVSVIDFLAGTTFVSATNGATYNPGPNTVTWSTPLLANGASTSFTITVATTAGMAGTTVSNTASVSTTTSDPNTTNNTSTATTSVGAVTTFSAPSATGTGTINVALSGGGAGCSFATAQMIPVFGGPNSPNSAPGGVVFPHGLFDFTLTGCTAASTVTLTITYPSALPAGTNYWKYGPTPGIPSPHWYTLPATIVGAVATFTITDGGLGDDDVTANGTIVDQGGPGIPGPPGTATAIPTLSEWTLMLLGLLLLASGAVAMRNRQRQVVRR